MPLNTVLGLIWDCITWEAKILPSVESSQPGTNNGIAISAAAITQLSCGLPSILSLPDCRISKKNSCGNLLRLLVEQLCQSGSITRSISLIAASSGIQTSVTRFSFLSSNSVSSLLDKLRQSSIDSYFDWATSKKTSSSRFAPVHEIPATTPLLISGASVLPSLAVLIAPAKVMNSRPPLSINRVNDWADLLNSPALKW